MGLLDIDRRRYYEGDEVWYVRGWPMVIRRGVVSDPRYYEYKVKNPKPDDVYVFDIDKGFHTHLRAYEPFPSKKELQAHYMRTVLELNSIRDVMDVMGWTEDDVRAELGL